MKEILFTKKPNKITMVHECQIWEKHFLFKKKKNKTKLPWPMSAKSDT